MAQITVEPETFTMVSFEADTVRALAGEVADALDLAADLEVTIVIDEVLPMPITASLIDVDDGRAVAWYSGGNFEDPRYRGQLDEGTARVELARGLRRAADRLTPAFADAPRDIELTDRQRAAWEVWADGRLARRGFEVREPLRRYQFRLAHGFSDATDAVFDRLWSVDDLDWAGLDDACAQTLALDDRAPPKRTPGERNLTMLRRPGASE